MHGMPCSALCGQGPDCMTDFGREIFSIKPTNCVILGARDLDPLEEIRMREHGVHFYSVEQIRRRGLKNVLAEAVVFLCGNTDGFHMSFDIDSLSPEAAPGTGTPVHGGLTPEEAYEIAEVAAGTKRLVSMDMVEVNPELDGNHQTAVLAAEIILRALGKK